LLGSGVGFVGEGERRSGPGCGVFWEWHTLSLSSTASAGGPVPLSTFVETSLREHSAIEARFKASWRRLALLPMLPFVAGERGLSLTWRGVLVGVETMGAGGGGVAGRDGDVAGATVGGGWV
jgi:hypothetical protein